jgi:hypothetical protein
MKLILLFSFVVRIALAQATLEGNWEGARVAGQSRTRVLLVIAAQAEGRYRGSITNLDAGTGSVLSEVSVSGDSVKFESFAGTLNADRTEI